MTSGRDSPRMTHVRDWQRLRLDPSVSRAWTRAGDLRLGFDVEIARLPHQTAQWLTLFDGTQSARALMEAAAAIGIDSTQALLTLERLASNGLIHQVDTLPSALGDTRITSDARATGQALGKTAIDVVEMRQSVRLHVVGAGVVSYAIVQRLEQLGYLCGWDIESQHRVTNEEVQLAQLPTSWVNTKWRERRRLIQEPHIVIAIADIIDVDHLDLQYPSSLVLPIQVRIARCEVGPVLHHQHSVCARCVMKQLASNEPDWNLLLTQWLHHTRALPVISITMLENIASMTVAVINQLVATSTNDLVSKSSVYSASKALWREVEWERGTSTECQCNLVLM